MCVADKAADFVQWARLVGSHALHKPQLRLQRALQGRLSALAPCWSAQAALMEEAAVLWKRLQGLSLCQAEAKLAEQAALRASDACSAEQALRWREAAVQLQAAAEPTVRPDCSFSWSAPSGALMALVRRLAGGGAQCNGIITSL